MQSESTATNEITRKLFLVLFLVQEVQEIYMSIYNATRHPVYMMEAGLGIPNSLIGLSTDSLVFCEQKSERAIR